MRRAAECFYRDAVKIGVHSFIEFTGLLNEYIKICEAAEATGDSSWSHANTHSETPLAMREHHIAYLIEKLDCIYGPSLRANPKFQAMVSNPG